MFKVGADSEEDEESKSNDEDDEDNSQKQMKIIDESYKTKAYWQLPENVRNAIDVAKMKAKHSEFYYRLQRLSNKILVFRSVFYSRIPKFQRAYAEAKR